MAICDENKPYIFISYSHRDSEKVFGIINRLRNEGYNVWFDGGIDPGTEWDENIARHIQESAYFIAFVSEGYINSKNCKDELNYSRDLDKEQLLVYLEDVQLPGGMAMRMNRIQAIWWNKYENDIESAYAQLFSAYGIDRTKINEAGAVVDNVVPVSTTTASDATTVSTEPKAGGKQLDKKVIIGAAVAAVVVLVAIIALATGKKNPAEDAVEVAEESISEAASDEALDDEASVDAEEVKDEDEQADADASESADAVSDEALAFIDLADGAYASQDYTTAYEYYRKASELGNGYAEYKIGQMYEQGYGVNRDVNKAYDHYEESTNRGYVLGYPAIGYLYAFSFDADKRDANKAAEYFNKAIELDDNCYDAYTGLGRLYGTGIYGLDDTDYYDYESTYNYYMKGWSNGEGRPYAAFLLGNMYEFGQFVSVDNAKAREYYQAAYDRGLTYDYVKNAINRVDTLLSNANLTQEEIAEYFDKAEAAVRDENYEESFNCYMKLAGTGNAIAIDWIGRHYRNGWYVDKNLQSALDWFCKSGDACGYCMRGYILRDDYNMIPLSKACFKKSIELGDYEDGLSKKEYDSY